MKKLLPGIVLIAVFVLAGVVSSNFTGQANAEKDSEKHSYNHTFTKHGWLKRDHDGEKEHGWKFKSGNHLGQRSGLFSEDVNRQIEIIENGVTIEITSSDTETITRIQEFGTNEDSQKRHKGWSSPSITKDTEIIDGGVRITVISDDPDEVTRLQEKLTSDNKSSGFRWHHRNHQE